MNRKKMLTGEIRQELKQVFNFQEDRVRIYDDFDIKFKEYLLDAPDFNLTILETICKETADRMNSISQRIIEIKLKFSPQVYDVPLLFELVKKLQSLEKEKFKTTLEYYVIEQQRLQKLRITDEFELELKQKLNQFKKENSLMEAKGLMTEIFFTKYDKLVDNIENNPEYKKEIMLNKLVGFYRIGSEIGIGNFSKVKLGLHLLTKEKVAIKILNKLKLDNKTQRLLLREISSMQKLHHPHIIRLYEVIHTQERLFICMEYASEGEVYSKVSNDGRISELESRIIFSQIISAVDHLHSCNIIHRDIKAENIFFSNLNPINVKLGDFGFSIEATIDRELNTYCGSPPYAAPELFHDDHYIGIYVDIWALGVLLYFMVSGQMPFRADTVSKLKRLILNGDYTIPSFVSETCQFLIKGILRPVPKDRFSIKEIMHSAWLDSEKFSEPLLSFQFNPNLKQSELSKEELYSLKILESLGIKRDHLILSNLNDSKSQVQKQNTQMNNLVNSRALSNITNTVNDNQINLTYELKQSINGTFRIIFHLVQKKFMKENLSELDSNSFFTNEFSSVESIYRTNNIGKRNMRNHSCSSDDGDTNQERFQGDQESRSIFVKLNSDKKNTGKNLNSKLNKANQTIGQKNKHTNFSDNKIAKKSAKPSSKFCLIL